MRKTFAYIAAPKAKKWKHVFYVPMWQHRRDHTEWLQDQELPHLWLVKGVRIGISDDKLALAFQLRWT